MSTVERIRKEVREIGLVTLYFLAFFLFFLLLKKLLLDEYDIETTVLGTAIVGALIVAKVVVILEKTSWGDWFGSSRVFVHLLWRSLSYTAAVFVVSLAERLFDQYREVGDLSAAFARVWAAEGLDEFFAMNLAVGFSFLIYNTFAEINRYLGEGELRRLLFAPRRVHE